MKRTILATIALALALPAQPRLFATENDEFVVIVHRESRATTVTRTELSKIFLKRLSSWKDGSRAVPVDQAPESSVRQAFNRQVHDRNMVNIEVYWKRMIFSGRSVPPPELRSDAEVLDFVRRTPGAVGYVDARADLEGVVALRLLE